MIDKIITASAANFSALCGDFVRVELHHTTEKAGPKLDTIRLFDLAGQDYYLPLEKCQTWFVGDY